MTRLKSGASYEKDAGSATSSNNPNRFFSSDGKPIDFLEPGWYYFSNSIVHRRPHLATKKKELDTLATGSFFKCSNKRCLVLIPGIDLKRNNGKCPICNTLLAKPR